jgi:peptidoglycan/xylan/chitin deacetylase (PgdA/CDA1 family)
MLLLLSAAAFGVIFLAHTAPFRFVLDGLAPGESVWRMPDRAGPPTIYLTFDDGPNPEATPELLDVLASLEAVATFFVIDDHVTEDTAPIVRRMFDEGHAVALHSDTRLHMMMEPDELAATLTAAADKIELLTGSRPCRAYRPHAGWRSGNMYAGLARIDHRLVGWGWMLWDWNWFRRPRPERLARRLARRASPGDIVVMHDGHHENPRADRRHTIDATAKLVPALRARGFVFGTIC